MPENSDVIAIFSIYHQFRAIQKLSSDAQTVKPIFSLIVTYLSETENRTKISLNTTLTLLL